jgi:hypothetical protein
MITDQIQRVSKNFVRRRLITKSELIKKTNWWQFCVHNYQMTNLKQINAAVRWQTYGLDKNSCVSIKFVCAWLCVCAYYNGPIIFDRLFHPSLYNFPFLSLIIYARNQLFSVGNFPRIFFFPVFCLLGTCTWHTGWLGALRHFATLFYNIARVTLAFPAV